MIDSSYVVFDVGVPLPDVVGSHRLLLFPAHRSLFAAHRSLFATHRSLFATHRLLYFPAHRSLFASHLRRQLLYFYLSVELSGLTRMNN
jgi:hypothetical protein